MEIFGREKELKTLKSLYEKRGSQLVAIYGRRRVGKSYLVDYFGKNIASTYFSFEGLERQSSQEQINNFISRLKEQFQGPYLDDINFKDWETVFQYLTEYVFTSKNKIVISFDEFQWMAAGQTKLISLLKYYWDKHWLKQNIMLILCGSVASFMVNKVINSSALYGRINGEILLRALEPRAARLFFKKSLSDNEILKYLIVFGTIPKYLKTIKSNLSFNQNMNLICFNKNSEMILECDRIFFSQFKEVERYRKIVLNLKQGMLSLEQIRNKLNLSSGGSLSHYLNNLLNAEIIKEFYSLSLDDDNKYRKYKLSDEFLIFYFKYMAPNLKLINEELSSKLFEELCESEWKPWLGLAFERFCLKHAASLAKIMEFNDEVRDFGPIYQSEDKDFQFDLVYKRKNKLITVCEIKFNDKPIDHKIIPEMEKKLAKLKIPRGFSLNKALISLNGASSSLKETEYFDYILDAKSILQP